MDSGLISETRTTPLQSLKRLAVQLLGRERANRITAPLYDWLAQRRSARALAALPARDLLLNIGCGPNTLDGWVNLDMARGENIVVWDLRLGLPVADASCAAIFGEHVIEHMPKEAAAKLLRECHRALQKGGVLRLSTPDAGR
ncbi:MAG TPA: methyltransferase domain-containing protein, partial [Pyrinomonadaceae bacterium]|nr:methyltransferase domain-containing protein [Pyrinomonadaceae bacterium]